MNNIEVHRLDLPWSTIQSLYRAKNGEVIEGKYVRVSGYCYVFEKTAEVTTDCAEVTPIYKMVFRNLDDGCLYLASRVMHFDMDLSIKNKKAMFKQPFDQGNISWDYSSYLVEYTTDVIGSDYYAVIPN